MKRVYGVTITETLQKKISVEADSAEDAERTVIDGYRACHHVLDADDFVGYEISARERKDYEIQS